MRTATLAIGGGMAVIVLGLMLAPEAPAAGAVITVGGIVFLAAFLLRVFRVAWSGDQKRAWDPGSLRREDTADDATPRT